MGVTTGTVWPSGGQDVHYQALAAVFYLFATSIFGVFLALRVPKTIAGFRTLSVAKWCVLLVFIDSWLFMFFSGVLVLGIGTSMSMSACAAGIWWCIALYASSKIFIYCFLLERLHLVWKRDKEGRDLTRWQSPMYRLSLVFLFAWIAVAVTMAVGRVSYIRESDQACVIGLKLWATVPMLTVDFIVNVYLTLSFVVPIMKTKFAYSKRLAFKSCAAAIVALITSFVNIIILTTLHGRQLSWVCLMSCGLDVTLNAIIIFIVTISRSTVTIQRPSEETSISLPYRGPASVAAVDYNNDSGDNTDSEKMTPPARNVFESPEKPARQMAKPTPVQYTGTPIARPPTASTIASPVSWEQREDMTQEEKNAATADMFKDYEQHYGELQTVLQGSSAQRQGRYY